MGDIKIKLMLRPSTDPPKSHGFHINEGSNTGNKNVPPIEDKMLYQKLRTSNNPEGPTLVFTLLHITNPSVWCVLLASKFRN